MHGNEMTDIKKNRRSLSELEARLESAPSEAREAAQAEAAAAAFLVHVGERLRIARKSANITQAQLAKSLSVSQSTISRMETGKDIPLDLLHQYSEACGVTPFVTFAYTEQESLAGLKPDASLAPGKLHIVEEALSRIVQTTINDTLTLFLRR